jgi:hypothetical protein
MVTTMMITFARIATLGPWIVTVMVTMCNVPTITKADKGGSHARGHSRSRLPRTRRTPNAPGPVNGANDRTRGSGRLFASIIYRESSHPPRTCTTSSPSHQRHKRSLWDIRSRSTWIDGMDVHRVSDGARGRLDTLRSPGKRTGTRQGGTQLHIGRSGDLARARFRRGP